MALSWRRRPELQLVDAYKGGELRVLPDLHTTDSDRKNGYLLNETILTDTSFESLRFLLLPPSLQTP